MQTKSFSMKMKDGTEIFLNRWMPDNESDIKGVVQLHHGIAEHSMRYDRIGSVMAENGYVFNAYDMRGHGKTAETALNNGTGLFGKLADYNGFNIAIEDLFTVTNELKKDFPDKKVIILGHSFGSFVSQGFIEKYGSYVDGCILLGTAGPRYFTIGAGKVLAKIVKKFKGADYISPLLDKIAFGSYNKRISEKKSKHGNDWLSKNESNIHLYEMDNWCGFKLTTSFFVDLLCGLSQIHKMSNIKSIPKDLPVYFLYGTEDPVGTYGKTIKKLYSIYNKTGMSNVNIKAYEGDRHELLNEDNKETVEKDIISWISQI